MSLFVTALPFLLAVQAVAGAADPGTTYDALVARAVAAARAGEGASAEALLERARSLDPARPEAPIELAGLRFVEGRYLEAIGLLKPVVRHRPDDHARDLFATSLHLAGRPDEAVEQWNPLRRPVLRNVNMSGIHDTRARLLMPQIALVEGAILTRDQLRETRLRLRETGAFARVSVRPVPLGTGEADVDVALVERRGFGSPPEWAAATVSKALQRTAWLRYDNLDGTGISVRGSYRWEETQPRAELALAWPRPLGLGGTLRAQGEWERARYAFDDGRAAALEARGAELAFRSVLGPRTVGEVGWRGRNRTFSGLLGGPIPSARSGRVSVFSLRFDHRLAEGWRHTVDATSAGFAAAAPLGSGIRFSAYRLGVRTRVSLGDGEGRSAIAAQIIAGGATRGAPLDEMFVPGAASEMDLPLRAYRHRDGGILGRTPIGRSLVLANLEWRPWLAEHSGTRIGGVLFYDAARIGGGVADSGHAFLHDLGAGFRLSVLGVVVRADYAVSLSRPSSRALTAGVGQVF